MPMSEALLSYTKTVALLGRYDIPMAEGRLVQAATEAAQAAQALGFPVALKALSPELTHKSDAGLVQLNLSTVEEVRAAAGVLVHRTAGHLLEGILVQAMVPGGIETIVGITTDPQFGPVIAFGPGGTLVELLDDVVLRLPPLTAWQAREMVREASVWRLLQGFREHPPADVAALIRLLVNASRLAVEQSEHVISLDLNPVIVLPDGEGIAVVDFRVFVQEEGVMA